MSLVHNSETAPQWARCPETITSPIADEYGMEPNQPCDLLVEIVNPAPVMHLRCGRGHEFFARPDDALGALEAVLVILEEFREPYPLMREDSKLDQIEDIIRHALGSEPQ